MLETGKADQDELEEIESKAFKTAKTARGKAWEHYMSLFQEETKNLTHIVEQIQLKSPQKLKYIKDLETIKVKPLPTRRAFYRFAKRVSFELHGLIDLSDEREKLAQWIRKYEKQNTKSYNTNLYREGTDSAIRVKGISATYPDSPIHVNGSQILNQNFDSLFRKYPNLITFGEDTGLLGDVNQGMKGMQAKYGADRVSDTGIRETTSL